MPFTFPEYTPPDFTAPPLDQAPPVRFERTVRAGVAPDNYHATSVFPEYYRMAGGEWTLLAESRMDCVVVLKKDGSLAAVEFRNLEVGDQVAVGRGENGEDGIFVHTGAFSAAHPSEKFAFRTSTSRETAFSIDYDELYRLLPHEREKGCILWVVGPAVVFDRDARNAFVSIIEMGYVHILFGGNALATHDIEGALFQTALGQEIYSKQPVHLGHYKHLDAINMVRSKGSIENTIQEGLVRDGVMQAVIRKNVPYVLAGSIRDDGPLPGIITDSRQAQDRMRLYTRKATTVIALATQLHSIATGNITPSYQVLPDGSVRPVYFYCVDMTEFAVNKLADRGSVTARSILTNVQDFVVTLERALSKL